MSNHGDILLCDGRAAFHSEERAILHNAEALLIFHVGEARDKDIALVVARDRMLVPEFLNFGYQNQSLLSGT